MSCDGSGFQPGLWGVWKLLRRLTLFALLVGGTLLTAWLATPLDPELVHFPNESVEVTDRYGNVLIQRVGADDQWRSPVSLSEVSPWIRSATLAIEDRRFETHAGVDFPAVARAMAQNARSGRVVSGASTITMQLCRMAEDRPRRLDSKIIETVNALKLERSWSKDRILEAYLNIAPYGGNIRGIEAASRRWLGKSAADVSPAEAAFLAGLPQSPSRYRPDAHLARGLARQKEVLAAMRETGCIDGQQYEQALAQPIRILEAPSRSPAMVAGFYCLSRRPGGGRSTLELPLMRRIEQVIRSHLARLPSGTCASAVVVDVETSRIRAMVSVTDGSGRGRYLNLAQARRSPGSTLKPFIYAAAIEAGRLGPDSPLWDIPFRQGGWEPENFDGKFLGEMTARDALRQSRNIPAIHVAREVGLVRCLGLLDSAGLDLGPQAQRRGGLALVTGAVEVSLLDLTQAYGVFARGGKIRPAVVFPDVPAPGRNVLSQRVSQAINSMLLRRTGPDGLGPACMSKTGTSSSRRDAWTLGHNGKVVLGVWVGRLRGAGRQEYVGSRAAQPLFDDILQIDAIRNDLDLPSIAPEAVSHPISRPEHNRSQAPRILSPPDGLTLQAVGGTSSVQLQCSEGQVQWFLDDRRLVDGASRLDLGPGKYELRCVDATGAWDRVRFEILP